MTRIRSDRTPQQLRSDALAIWSAGVRAVQGFRLVTEQLVIDDHWLGLPEQDLWIDLRTTRKIFVAGAGKATASMARGVAQVLAPQPVESLNGHVQIPEEAEFDLDATSVFGAIDLRSIMENGEPSEPIPDWLKLYHVRPAGSNLVTDAAVAKTQELCQKLQGLGPNDVCLFLLSGGASALLSAPVAGLSFAEKNHVTRFLSSVGAPIEELNIVRFALSVIKAGGLARHCRAGLLVTLILSDVLGDPLPYIGSGPTFTDGRSAAERASRAMDVLRAYDPHRKNLPMAVYGALDRQMQPSQANNKAPAGHANCEFVVLGNTATAVDAAGIEAERRGYSHAMHVQPPQMPERGSTTPSAESNGLQWADWLSDMNQQAGPDCLIVGGESVVDLSGALPESRGGRNQHLGLAALEHWERTQNRNWQRGEICFVSGGTDGEDGNTTVAGVCLSPELRERCSREELDIRAYLDTKNSYNYFRQTGGLLITGNTQTNVCDLQVGVVRQRLASS
jgi:glycerate 2-kinase